MTRKDYVAIAKALTEAKASASAFTAPTAETVLGFVAIELAAVFAADNPNFDEARFFAAAGV